MDEEQYKQRLRKCVVIAARHHRKYDIAKEIECSRQALSNFISGGPLGAKYRANLEEWLRKHGYWVGDESDNVKSNATQAQRILAHELRSMAEILESEMSDRFKAERFTSFVTGYAKAYEEEMRASRPE